MPVPSVVQSLSPLLKPSSVAVIGASADRHRIRGKILHTLRVGGYPGEIFPVNPGHAEIQGLRCYPDIGALPHAPDLVMLAVPAESVPGALEQAATAGAKAAVVYTAAAAQVSAGQESLHARIAAIAGRTGLRVLGPNTEGFFNVADAVAANFSVVVEDEAGAASRLTSPARRVSIVSQSGGIGFGLYSLGRRSHLRFRHVITTGNESDVASLELAEYLIAEGETAVIMMFIEGFKQPERFVTVASAAAEAGVPLVVMKAGRSPASQRAAISHTAHLTGADTAYEAVFRRYGVIRVTDPEEMIATAAALCQPKLPRGNRIGILAGSGGTGTWLADICSLNGLDVPEPSPTLRQDLASVVPEYGSVANPIDVTARLIDDGGKTLCAVLGMIDRAEEFDSLIVNFSLAPVGRVRSFFTSGLDGLLGGLSKPMVFVSQTLPSDDNLAALAETGFHNFSFRGAGNGLRALAQYAEFQARWHARPTAPERCRSLLGMPTQDGPLDTAVLHRLLQAYDIPLPEEVLADTVEAVVAAAERIGYPVALKVQSPDLPHKTEAGAVALDLRDAGQVRAAHDRILASVRRYAPDARVAGVLVQKMMPPGREMVVGMVRDPDFGPLLMLGFGGIYVEVLRDVVIAPAPVGPDEARAMIGRLQGAAMLQGVRGEPPSDTEALADLLTSVSRLAVDTGMALQELDLNPVLVYPRGVCAVDALASVQAGRSDG